MLFTVTQASSVMMSLPSSTKGSLVILLWANNSNMFTG